MFRCVRLLQFFKQFLPLLLQLGNSIEILNAGVVYLVVGPLFKGVCKRNIFGFVNIFFALGLVPGFVELAPLRVEVFLVFGERLVYGLVEVGRTEIFFDYKVAKNVNSRLAGFLDFGDVGDFFVFKTVVPLGFGVDEGAVDVGNEVSL